ncbi:hypothetical protein [Mollivirus kamchatka]|nr:hypothetical protein [Mollivirus kamchatka]
MSQESAPSGKKQNKRTANPWRESRMREMEREHRRRALAYIVSGRLRHGEAERARATLSTDRVAAYIGTASRWHETARRWQQVLSRSCLSPFKTALAIAALAVWLLLRAVGLQMQSLNQL